LQSWGSENDVFQRFLPSIVLALAITANPMLLCHAWCHPAAGAGGCHHEDPSTFARVATGVGCSDASIGAAAFTRESLRSDSFVRDTTDAVVVALYRFARSTTDIGIRLQSLRVSPLARRPLVTALRI
jgi:hypothetical protein